MKIFIPITRLNIGSVNDVFHVIEINGVYNTPTAKEAWLAYQYYKLGKNSKKTQDVLSLLAVHRYYLELTLESGASAQDNGVLITFMKNASETFYNEEECSCEIDENVQNVCRLAYAAAYSKVVVLSCNSLIEQMGDFFERDTENVGISSPMHVDMNKKYIEDCLQTNSDILLVTGDSDVSNDVLDILKSNSDNANFYAFALYENYTPKHLSLIVPHNRELIDKVINQRELIKVEVDWDKSLNGQKIICKERLKGNEKNDHLRSGQAISLCSFECVVDDSILDGKTLIEVNDSNVLSMISNIIPNANQTIANTKLAVGGIYKAILPAGETLANSEEIKGAVRGFFHDTNGIKGHANFINVSGTAALNAVMSAAAMVVGQYYMTRINEQLGDINKKLDNISSFQNDEYQSKIVTLIKKVKKYTYFQTEIMENEELRNRELNHLNILEDNCSDLLGHANNTIRNFTNYTFKKFDEYESMIPETLKWYQYQQILLIIMKTIADLSYTFNLGKVSAENCNELYLSSTKDAIDSLNCLKEWHLENCDRFEVDVVSKVRELKGFEWVKKNIPVFAGLIHVAALATPAVAALASGASALLIKNKAKISDQTFSMIIEQFSEPAHRDDLGNKELFNKDVSLIVKEGKMFYMLT